MTDSRRRVLVLNHFAAPLGEAGGTRHVELFSRLGEPWEYLVIASDLNPQTGRRISSVPGLSVVSVPTYSSNGARRILNWLAYTWRALVLGLRQRHVSVVYGSSPHLLAGLAAWLLSVRKQVPFVLEVRDLWPQILVDAGTLNVRSPVYRALSALETFLYRRADHIVVLAPGTEDDLIRRGVPAAKVHFIPNGPDPSDFVPSSSREELRALFGFTRFTAVYAGAHGPANGLDAVLNAAATLDGGQVEIVLVGGGIEKGRLVERATREGLTHVRFLDPIPKSSIPDLLAAADAGLHVLADLPLFKTSVSPNKMFDYMAAGLPVVTNCQGTVGDIVANARCGQSVDFDEITRGVNWLFERSPAERELIGQNGKRWIELNQSRSKMASRLVLLLDSAIEARTR